jgi:type I restriction enzyme R subunit
MLRKLLSDEIRTVQRTNLVQARRFSEQLDDAINRYTNRALTTAEIIAELVKLAKQMRDAARRHEQLGLSVAEAALYDAIVQNDAAVLQMGDATLKKIAVDLVWAVQQSVTIDWSQGVGARGNAGQDPAAAGQVRLPARPGGQGRRAHPRTGRALRGARVAARALCPYSCAL